MISSGSLQFDQHKRPMTHTVSIATSSQFQGALEATRNAESPCLAMQKIAQGFIGSHNFVNDLSSLTYYQQLYDFSSGIVQAKDLNLTKLRHLVSTIFKADPKDLVSNKNFSHDKERVFDSLVALMIVPIGQPFLTRDLSKFAPLFALIERIAAEDESLDRLLESAELPHMHFHDLRHSAASILLSMGVNPKVIQELLGHSEMSITLGTYSHLFPTMQEEAMGRWDGVFGDGTDDGMEDERG